jgi:hypothetical protein
MLACHESRSGRSPLAALRHEPSLIFPEKVAAYQGPAHAGSIAERVAHLFAASRAHRSPVAVTGGGAHAQLPDNWYKIMAGERDSRHRTTS